MRPAAWGLGIGAAVGLGLVMGLLGAPPTAPTRPASGPAEPAPLAPAETRGVPPRCPAPPDPALAAALAEAEAELTRLQVRNDAADGPGQPWSAEAEVRLPALEDATRAAVASAGLSVVELDCGERPCLLSVEGPIESAGADAAAWVGPLAAALAAAGVTAHTVRHGVRRWPDAAAEGALLLLPEGVVLSPEARAVADRRLRRADEERMAALDAAAP